MLQPVQRTPHAARAPLQVVRVDHRRRDIGVLQQLLNRSDVRPGVEQVGGETMSQRVAARLFCQLRLEDRVSDQLLDGGLEDVMQPQFPSRLVRVDAQPRGGEDILPDQLTAGVRVFLSQLVR